MGPVYPEPAMEWGQGSVSECVSLFNFFLFQLHSSAYVVRVATGTTRMEKDISEEREPWVGPARLCPPLSCQRSVGQPGPQFFHLKPLACTHLYPECAPPPFQAEPRMSPY